MNLRFGRISGESSGHLAIVRRIRRIFTWAGVARLLQFHAVFRRRKATAWSREREKRRKILSERRFRTEQSIRPLGEDAVEDE